MVALRHDRVATAAFVTLTVVVALAILAPYIVPQNPYNLAEVDVLDSRLPPGSKGIADYTHWLGTDGAGRDLVDLGARFLRRLVFRTRRHRR